MRSILAILVVICAVTDSGHAMANPITYSESITTDGVLGGTAFTNQLVTLTFMADTTNVTGSGKYTNVPSLATVTVAGVGTATLSDAFSLSVEAFPTFSEFSATDTSMSTDILDTFAVASGFAGYNMATALVPVSGGAAYSVGTLFGTNEGNFDFTKNGGGVSTVAVTVPEPSSLSLFVLGIVGLAAHRRTGRRMASSWSKTNA